MKRYRKAFDVRPVSAILKRYLGVAARASDALSNVRPDVLERYGQRKDAPKLLTQRSQQAHRAYKKAVLAVDEFYNALEMMNNVVRRM